MLIIRPPLAGAPFLAAVILAVGWRTILNGLKALAKLNFKSINLLMVIAVAGAFYLVVPEKVRLLRKGGDF